MSLRNGHEMLLDLLSNCKEGVSIWYAREVLDCPTAEIKDLCERFRHHFSIYKKRWTVRPGMAFPADSVRRHGRMNAVGATRSLLSAVMTFFSKNDNAWAPAEEIATAIDWPAMSKKLVEAGIGKLMLFGDPASPEGLDLKAVLQCFLAIEFDESNGQFRLGAKRALPILARKEIKDILTNAPKGKVVGLSEIVEKLDWNTRFQSALGDLFSFLMHSGGLNLKWSAAPSARDGRVSNVRDQKRNQEIMSLHKVVEYVKSRAEGQVPVARLASILHWDHERSGLLSTYMQQHWSRWLRVESGQVTLAEKLPPLPLLPAGAPRPSSEDETKPSSSSPSTNEDNAPAEKGEGPADPLEEAPKVVTEAQDSDAVSPKPEAGSDPDNNTECPKEPVSSDADADSAKQQDYIDVDADAVAEESDPASGVTPSTREQTETDPDTAGTTNTTEPTSAEVGADAPDELDEMADSKDHPQLWNLFEGKVYIDAVLDRAIKSLADIPPEPLTPFDPKSIEGLPSDEALGKLGEYVVKIYENTRAKAGHLEARSKLHSTLREDLRTMMKDPEITLYVFGSCAYHLCTGSTDVDLCVVLGPDKNGHFDREEVIRKIVAMHDVLKSKYRREAFNKIFAYVPIIKGKLQGLEFDLSMSFCGVLNSTLMRTYIEKNQAILHPLAILVIAWSKAELINDSRHGFFSSYTLMLMLIYFLIRCGEIERVPIDTAFECQENPMSMLSSNGVSHDFPKLGRLFCGFLSFYTETFQYDTEVVNIRSPNRLTKQFKKWEDCCFACEDPLETHLNTARHIEKTQFGVIQHAMKLMLLQLKKQGDGWLRRSFPLNETQPLPPRPAVSPPARPMYMPKPTTSSSTNNTASSEEGPNWGAASSPASNTGPSPMQATPEPVKEVEEEKPSVEHCAEPEGNHSDPPVSSEDKTVESELKPNACAEPGETLVTDEPSQAVNGTPEGNGTD